MGMRVAAASVMQNPDMGVADGCDGEDRDLRDFCVLKAGPKFVPPLGDLGMRDQMVWVRSVVVDWILGFVPVGIWNCHSDSLLYSNPKFYVTLYSRCTSQMSFALRN
jgi:hypothetical protein